MSVNADTLRRLAALRLPADAMCEVLSIIADMQAADEARKSKDRKRKRGVQGNSEEIPRNIQGKGAENPGKIQGSSPSQVSPDGSPKIIIKPLP